MHADAGELDDADDAEEEVDGGEAGRERQSGSRVREERCRHVQVVLGLDDEAPARPDEAGAGEGKVLRDRQLLGGTGKVGDAGEDERPLLRISIIPSCTTRFP